MRASFAACLLAIVNAQVGPICPEEDPDCNKLSEFIGNEMIAPPSDILNNDGIICDPDLDPDCNKDGREDPADSDSMTSDASESQTSESDSDGEQPCPKNDPDCHKEPNYVVCPDSDPDCDKQTFNGNCPDSDPDCYKQTANGNCPDSDPDCDKQTVNGNCPGPDCSEKIGSDLVCIDEDPACTKKFAYGSCPDTDPDCDKLNGGDAVATEVVELIDGFLLGALETERLTSVETCVADFDPLVLDMVTAVQSFEQGGYHKIADGIYQLGQFVSQVGTVMKDCAALSGEDIITL